MNNNNEKRKSERIPLNNSIEVFIIKKKENGKESIRKLSNCRCLDISTGGILIGKDINEYGTGGACLKTEENIPAGTHIQLRVHLNMEILNEDFTARAVVVNSTPGDGFYYIHLSFEKLLKCSIDSDIYRKIDSLPGF